MAGIPTTYRGTRFRSRTEARWAVLFDAIGWKWEYEPLDADGYVPDFAILGATPLLVEVKADMTTADLDTHVSKITAALPGSWDRDVLVVGGSWSLAVEDGYHVAGVLLEWGEWGDGAPETTTMTTGWAGGSALWNRCAECGGVAVHHQLMTWSGRPCGHYDGDHLLEPTPVAELETAWARARNTTQWKPTGR